MISRILQARMIPELAEEDGADRKEDHAGNANRFIAGVERKQREDRGEADLLAVALREANEESGVTGSRPVTKEPISLEILTVNPHYKRGKFVSAHLHLNLTYLLEADETQPVRVKPDENSAVRWLPVEDICAAVSEPDMLPVYQKLLDRVKK